MKPVSPRNYTLLFEPDLKKFTFTGTAKIQANCNEKVGKITLNSADLEISKCVVKAKNKELETSFELKPEKEELVITLPSKIDGKVDIETEFKGVLNDKLAGFYRSVHKHKGKNYHMATTQFEAADARRAFPSFDEPEQKATFDISILAPPGNDAISNMPVKQKRKKSGKNLFVFERTPIMSTYLVYLGVGQFDYLEDKLGKVKIRIVTPVGRKSQAKRPLELTKQFLDYYQKYFEIPYPLPKLDMIAVPDFAAGAMENWGAITFREVDLLYDEDNSSTMALHRVAEVIAHELAHQWFGNLVTMKWWNDLWLNESFATFMATKAVDKIYPEWDFWDQFILMAMNEGLGLDALKTSHPINVKVTTPAQTREIFDKISYDKGASVLRMLEDFVTEEEFRKGLKLYLTQHKYKNTETTDLWKAIEESSKKPVNDMMNTWIMQTGYPMLEAKFNDSKLSLTQKRFLMLGSPTGKENWHIPISVRTKDKYVSELMTTKTHEINLGEADWFKINIGQKGFYRVRYPTKNINSLKELVEKKEIDNFDRWGIIADMFSLCVSGEVGVKEYFNFVESYQDEEDYLVFQEAAGSLFSTYILTPNEKFWDEIKAHNVRYFKKAFDKLGWDPREGEKKTTPITRSFVIAALGKLDDKEIATEAMKRFSAYLKDPSSLNPDLRSTVFGIVAWNGDEKTQDMLIDLYKKADTQEEKLRFFSALANVKDEKLIVRALDFALTPDVRTQDMWMSIARAEGNPYARKLIWPWLKKNWVEMSSRLKGMGIPMLKHIVESVSTVSDAKKETEIRKFFDKHHVPGTEMALAQTIERIKIRSNFLDRMRKEFQ